MDKERLLEIAAKSLRLCVAASVLAIAHSHPAIGQNAIAKKTLANELIVLLESVSTNQDIENVIESVWLHLKTVINKYLREKNVSEMDEKMENTLREPIRQIAKVDSPVRLLMCKYMNSTSSCNNCFFRTSAKEFPGNSQGIPRSCLGHIFATAHLSTYYL